MGAANGGDWYHKPSAGWCFSIETIRSVFGAPPDCHDNYADYNLIMDEVRDCSELRNNLHESYFKSGNNGMPWGEWDPKYLSVGIVVQKCQS